MQPSVSLSRSQRQSRAADIDWTKVDAALGKTAAVQGDVHRYGIPRSDLKVTLDGVTIKPALALGGWVAFEASNDGAMLMGDLVLTEDEVSPVMLKLMQSGIEITALHNHLIRATPATLYLHVRGHGDPVKLATALRAALAESKTPFDAACTYCHPSGSDRSGHSQAGPDPWSQGQGERWRVPVLDT